MYSTLHRPIITTLVDLHVILPRLDYDMFASTTQDHISASVNAGLHLHSWEKTLALRVSLQKPLDLANRLPSEFGVSDKGEIYDHLSVLTNQLRKQVLDGSDLLNSEVQRSTSERPVKQKRAAAGADDMDALWKDLYQAQTQLQTLRWEPVLNKWHARLNFGSEKTKAKLKVFTQTMWDQVEDTLLDDHRTVAKSRMPAAESRRVDLNLHKEVEQEGKLNGLFQSSSSTDNGSTKVGSKRARDEAAGEEYDHEVYDDRMFYAMLLKTFITSSSAGSSNGKDGADLAGTMRAGDLEALRQYKRKKANVERKASKGRKVRYNVHDKLQNFMFPLSLGLGPDVGGIDSE
eukprot:gene27423-30995_t